MTFLLISTKKTEYVATEYPPTSEIIGATLLKEIASHEGLADVEMSYSYKPFMNCLMMKL